MDSLEEKQKISLLLDIYGELLTDRQKDFLDLYYNEDLSYGEIAESENISRQAVHDTIHHGKKALLHFEEHLGLAQKKQEEIVLAANGDAGAPESASCSINLEELRKEIGELSRLVSVDITYDMVPIQRQVKRLKDLVGAERK